MNQYGQLLEVQRLDTAVDVIDRKLASLPEAETLAGARAVLARKASALEQMEGDLHVHKRQQTRLEEDVATLGEKLDREKTKLMSGALTNPKELAGLQQEVASLAARRDALETQLLEQMEKTEEADRLEAAARQARDSAAAEVAAAEEGLRVVTEDLGAQKSSLVADREKAKTGIDSTLLTRYEKLRPQFRGVAVGKLEGEMCTACRVDLPEIEAARIRRSDELERCPECRRLLITEKLLK
jgi:uncharacterized protein